MREGLRDGLRSGGGDRDLGDDDLGRGDAVPGLANGKRVGDGELKSLGLRCAPGGARGWSVGQKLKKGLGSSSPSLPELIVRGGRGAQSRTARCARDI